MEAELDSELMNRWMNEWVSEWMSEWMNEWIPGPHTKAHLRDITWLLSSSWQTPGFTHLRATWIDLFITKVLPAPHISSSCIELYRNASYSAKDVLIFQMNQLAHPSPVFLIKSLPTWPNGNHSPKVRPRLPCPPLVRHWAQRGMQSPGPPVGTRTPFMDVQKAAPRQAWPQPQSTPGSPHG